MELFPVWQLTLFNGWIFLIFFYILQFINLTFVSKEARARLLDRSTFTKKQWYITGIGKIFGVFSMLLMIITPLSQDIFEFMLGFSIYLIGMVCLRIATLNFINTPFDQPVKKGLYRISRNPQEAMLTVILLGIGIMVGSWVVIFLIFISRVFNHFQLIAQEEACLKQYGESYKEYMEEVPRYFLFF